MEVLALVHSDDAGPGVFAEPAAELGVRIREWRPASEPVPELDGTGALLVLGGVPNVHEEDRHPWLTGEKRLIRRALDGGVPALGVCLGSQLLADAHGGTVRRAPRHEIGWHEVELTDGAAGDPVIGALPERFTAFQWHSYSFDPPAGTPVLARNEVGAQACRFGEAAWGIQFHAEVTASALHEWLRDGRHGADALEAGLDPDAVARESESLLAGWNEIGRGIFRRFLEQAQR